MLGFSSLLFPDSAPTAPLFKRSFLSVYFLCPEGGWAGAGTSSGVVRSAGRAPHTEPGGVPRVSGGRPTPALRLSRVAPGVPTAQGLTQGRADPSRGRDHFLSPRGKAPKRFFVTSNKRTEMALYDFAI